jgi:hypothetical protein
VQSSNKTSDSLLETSRVSDKEERVNIKTEDKTCADLLLVTFAAKSSQNFTRSVNPSFYLPMFVKFTAAHLSELIRISAGEVDL